MVSRARKRLCSHFASLDKTEPGSLGQFRTIKIMLHAAVEGFSLNPVSKRLKSVRSAKTTSVAPRGRRDNEIDKMRPSERVTLPHSL